MSAASLLVFPADERSQNVWMYDHQQEHTSLTFAMAAPIQFSLANYLLDPFEDPFLHSGNWQRAHQQAHDDASSYYAVQPSQNMMDQAVGNPWWTFINYSEHLALNEAAGLRTILG